VFALFSQLLELGFILGGPRVDESFQHGAI
jgi:hypothetical protein